MSQEQYGGPSTWEGERNSFTNYFSNFVDDSMFVTKSPCVEMTTSQNGGQINQVDCRWPKII